MAKNITIYHVFTNNQDEFLEDFNQARKLFNQWKKDNGTARLYEEFWEDTELDDEPIKEECIRSFGEYPL